ncbi:phosphonate C-P lyase system protein PhnH [Thorsellia anophelis]|uniref:Alpha-D-ribose 1-methylphosphonate 5-triphosphate synthase subunit PhnH n=1 Tax=Thorsellia anophelis DSM 18579 TaxID=1123402 RepID=A0A1I0ARL9_9GAMM|nr:phosphonate C-P lyase system protein PhnH [Thorsellia anophelis]SES97004.1 alpha-D-ribose 1-methylphosphonate 5-triphosphate synthase subunit PhnH [Thorsellia anophelis DSM 18579]
MTLYTGFHSPCLDAQIGFKQVLDSLSQPGKINTYENWHFNWPTLNNASVACLLALCDQDTPVFIDKTLALSDISRSVAFHTQSKLTEQLCDAHFAFLDESIDLESLEQLNIGTDISPESSAFVIIQTKQLPQVTDNNDSTPTDKAVLKELGQTTLRLTGPGILGSRMITTALPVDILTYLVEGRKAFPKGVDFILTHQNSMLGIARTTQLEVISCM